MPLYYFHLRDGVDVLLDREGQELADADAVAAATLREVRAILGHDAAAGHLRLDQRIDVEDAAGGVVHSLRFEDAIRIVPRPPGAP